MAFDIEMIKSLYARFPERVDAAKKLLGRPMTHAEKVLYAHLDEGAAKETYERGKSYVDFRPDRVAMQDATAQMALLQFMQALKKWWLFLQPYTATTLSRPKKVLKRTLIMQNIITRKCMTFWLQYPINMVSVFGNRVPVLFIRLFLKIIHFRVE